MAELFSVVAPAYWAKGLPVIPLKVREKRPFFDHWQQWSDRLPTDAEQLDWLTNYKFNNIGLPLGKQSGVVIIDVDTEDTAAMDAIMSVLPKSPWVRTGRKGFALAYKFTGKGGFKITGKGVGMVVEMLSTGNQIVLPPSIHPDTGLPYTENQPLHELVDVLVPLPDDIEEKLRGALSGIIEFPERAAGKFKLTKFAAAGERDVTMTQRSGFYANAIQRGEYTVRQALDLHSVWCADYTAQTKGDPIDVEKGQRQIIQFLLSDLKRTGRILPPGWDDGLTPEQKLDFGIHIDESQEEWTCVQLTDYIFQKLEHSTSDADPERMKVVDFIVQKISKSKNLKEYEKEKVLKTLKAHSGTDVPLSAFKKEIAKLQAGPIEGANHTEIAEEVLKVYQERNGLLTFFQENFYQWTGSHWKYVEPRELTTIVAKEFGDLDAAKKAHDHKGIVETIRNLVPKGYLSNQPLEGINFANGFLTKELKLVPHQPEQGMTYALDYCYRPELAGKCPVFFKYLESSWGKHEDYEAKVQMCREAIATTIFGVTTTFQKAFLLKGVGQSGKSVLLKIIDAMLPLEAKVAIPPTKWSERFMPAQFAGKLLNIAGELDEYSRINGAVFKQLTTGESMDVERKGQNPFTMNSRCAHWFASNWLPKTRDTSHGFNRRWLILEFTEIVSDKDRIVDLAELIIDLEIEAIVAWAAEALPELFRRNAYTTCPSAERMVESMALSNSPVRRWFQEKIILVPGNVMKEKEIYQNFHGYSMSQTEIKLMSSSSFYTELKQLLMEKKLYNVKQTPEGEIYQGIGIKK